MQYQVMNDLTPAEIPIEFIQANYVVVPDRRGISYCRCCAGPLDVPFWQMRVPANAKVNVRARGGLIFKLYEHIRNEHGEIIGIFFFVIKNITKHWNYEKTVAAYSEMYPVEPIEEELFSIDLAPIDESDMEGFESHDEGDAWDEGKNYSMYIRL